MVGPRRRGRTLRATHTVSGRRRVTLLLSRQKTVWCVRRFFFFFCIFYIFSTLGFWLVNAYRALTSINRGRCHPTDGRTTDVPFVPWTTRGRPAVRGKSWLHLAPSHNNPCYRYIVRVEPSRTNTMRLRFRPLSVKKKFHVSYRLHFFKCQRVTFIIVRQSSEARVQSSVEGLLNDFIIIL